MQISQSINKFSLSPLYSWISSGIMTLPVCMDIGLMCLPLISLQLYSTFVFCLVTSQSTLLFDSSLLPSKCTLPLHIYHTMYKNKHSVIFQTLPIILKASFNRNCQERRVTIILYHTMKSCLHGG